MRSCLPLSIFISCGVSLWTGCGARTGLTFPVLPPSPVLPCSNTRITIPFAMAKAAGTPNLSVGVTSITWQISALCDPTPANSAIDPGVHQLPLRDTRCTVIQHINGDPEFLGSCTGEVGSLSGPVIQTGNSFLLSTFNYTDTLQGSVCVSGTLALSNGTTLPFEPPPATQRTWVRRATAPLPIDYTYVVNAAGVPATVAVAGVSRPGCP